MKEASCSKRGTKSCRDVDDEESKRETETERQRDVTKEGVRRGKEGKRRVKGEEERDWRLLACGKRDIHRCHGGSMK